MNERCQYDSTYDVIIVGGGLIGATMALLLAERSDWKIALLDANERPTLPDLEQGYDARINAYNPIAEQVLRRLGVWSLIDQSRCYPFYQLSVDLGDEDSSVVFAQEDQAKDLMQEFSPLGYFIENSLVRYYLFEVIAQSSQVTFYPKQCIDAISPVGGDWITLQTGEASFQAKLVIAADGPRSPLRDLAGIDSAIHDYEQRCLVGSLYFNGDHKQTAWQRFLSTGPFGLLPLAPGCCSLAWSMDNAYAQTVLAMHDDALLTEMTKHLDGHLGDLKALKRPVSFPLRALHAKQYFSGRLVLLGDAAHVVHPLAGQGANLGFKDAICLADLLLKAPKNALDNKSDLEALLMRYQRARKLKNESVMQAFSCFKYGFTHPIPGVGLLSKSLFSSINRIPLLKKKLLDAAMWLP